MEAQNGTGNDKQSELDSETKNNPSDPSVERSLPAVKVHPGPKDDEHIEGLSRSCSFSSSSSDNAKGHIDDPFEKAEQDGYQSPEPPDAPQWSMVSASPRGGSGNLSSTADGLSRTPEWVMSNSSPMKSPQVQAMGRGYDPNRIPSSIFASKPATPMDWSVASNESLFSIHMGNSSFSRDQAFQGEEWTSPEAKLNESSNFTPNLAPVAETPRQNDSVKGGNVYVRPGLEDEPNETPKFARGETGEANSKEKTPSNSPGVRLSTSSEGKGPRVSNESTKSSDSFAFPVLLMDGAKSGNATKTGAEKSQTPEAQTQEDPKSQGAEAAPASAGWFSCLNCWPARCC